MALVFNRMKLPLWYLLPLLSFLSPVHGQDQEKVTQHLTEIKALHDDYIRAQQAALIPVFKAYLEKLAQQRKAYSMQGDPETASLIDKEIARISNELTAAETSLTADKPVKIEIVTAMYGNLQGRPVNVTSAVKKAYDHGDASVSVNNDLAGKDPAPFVVKGIKITYLVGTVRQEKVFREGHVLNFAEDLR